MHNFWSLLTEKVTITMFYTYKHTYTGVPKLQPCWQWHEKTDDYFAPNFPRIQWNTKNAGNAPFSISVGERKITKRAISTYECMFRKCHWIRFGQVSCFQNEWMKTFYMFLSKESSIQNSRWSMLVCEQCSKLTFSWGKYWHTNFFTWVWFKSARSSCSNF